MLYTISYIIYYISYDKLSGKTIAFGLLEIVVLPLAVQTAESRPGLCHLERREASGQENTHESLQIQLP